MNTVNISAIYKGGRIISGSNQTLHLVGVVGNNHKTRAGEIKYERFRISAWGNTALRFNEIVRVGQVVVLKGYLTQGKTDSGATYTEICVEEFVPSVSTTRVKAVEAPNAASKAVESVASIGEMVASELRASIESMMAASADTDEPSLKGPSEEKELPAEVKATVAATDDQPSSVEETAPIAYSVEASIAPQPDSCVKRENGDADNSNMGDKRENEAVHGSDSFDGDTADPVTIGPISDESVTAADEAPAVDD